MTGYPDEPKDLQCGEPYWKMVPRNGYYPVDERTVGETGSRHMTVAFRHASEATLAAGALNDAYRRGRANGAKVTNMAGPNYGQINMGD